MFAVPGWSISNDQLKRQTQAQQEKQKQEQAARAEKNEAAQAEGGAGGASKSSKRKRKQGGKDGEVKVTKANLEELFRKHIQGEDVQTTKKPWTLKQEAKRRKLEWEKPKQAEETEKSDEQEGKQQQQPQGEGKRKRNRKPKGGKNKETQQKEKTETTGNETEATEESTTAAQPSAPAPVPAPAKLTPLQQAMRNKLLAARFRYLNETLYTTPSTEAYKLFSENPEFFNEYHAGFTRQVQELWPANPVDFYIRTINGRANVKAPNSKDKKQKPTNPSSLEPLPRRPNGLCNIADMGCGDAKLARTLTPKEKQLKLKFHNFDLTSQDPLVTKADIANLPLEDGSCDIAVFCLSLMGTNWISFVEEAWRVLRGDGKGECWVSEVKSRFGRVSKRRTVPDHSISKRAARKVAKQKKGQDEGDEVADEEVYAEDKQESSGDGDTDISAFVEVFKSRGFVLKQESVDKSNKMFVRMEFVKHGAVTKGKHAGGAGSQAGKVKKFIEKEKKEPGLTPEQEAEVLKPCVYKLR